jgi:hypothetical protein
MIPAVIIRPIIILCGFNLLYLWVTLEQKAPTNTTIRILLDLKIAATGKLTK